MGARVGAPVGNFCDTETLRCRRGARAGLAGTPRRRTRSTVESLRDRDAAERNLLGSATMVPELAFVMGGWRVSVSTHGLFVVLAVTTGLALAVRRAREPSVVLAAAPA